MKKILLNFFLISMSFFTILSSCNTSTSNDSSVDEQAKSVEKNYTLINQEDFSLEDYRGKIVILNFWASWCPPCRAEMPEFNQLNQELKTNEEVVLLLVNMTDGQRETKKRAEEYLQKMGYDFTVILDTKSVLSNQYRVSSIPQTFIIDRDGNEADAIIGQTSQSVVKNKLNKLLEGTS